MRKTITNLSGLIVALACMTATLRAQEVKTAQMGVTAVREHSVELRAAVATDSCITHNAAGDYLTKVIWGRDGNTYFDKGYRWEKNNWVFDSDVHRVEWGIWDIVPSYKTENNQLRFIFPGIYMYGWFAWESPGNNYKATNDQKGNLAEFEYKTEKFIISYNANNLPVTIERYNNGTLDVKILYEYSGYFCTLWEVNMWDNAKKSWVAHPSFIKEVQAMDGNKSVSYERYKADAGGNWVEDTKETNEYDADGKRWKKNEYIWYNNQWTLVQYTIYYPNSFAVANELVSASAPTAYAHGGTLYLQSPRAEKVAIYAISGAKLYEGAIPAGTTTIAARLPKGVCIVAFGDGTRRKVANN